MKDDELADLEANPTALDDWLLTSAPVSSEPRNPPQTTVGQSDEEYTLSPVDRTLKDKKRPCHCVKRRVKR